jgi:hypothetical protein
MTNENPFEKFIVDENAPLNKNLVAEIIESFVESIGRNKQIRYTEKFENSPSWIKIAIYLCFRKIMLDQNIISKEGVGPKEISEDTGISEDSAKDISRAAKLQKIVSKKGAGYFIENNQLKKLKKMIEENGK